MLPLHDRRWKTYSDAMGSRFDAMFVLDQLSSLTATKATWISCWNHLVYQGDIGEASYASIAYLADFICRSPRLDWNALALISAIELARPTGPEIPKEVEQEYFETIRALPMLLAQHPQVDWDELTTCSAASCIALARGQQELGRIYGELNIESGLRWIESEDG